DDVKKPAPVKQAKVKKEAKPVKKTEKRVLITGSRIPQKVERVGNTTIGSLYVTVYGGGEYANSGQSNLGEFLRRQPFAR
ncbi:MAG: hypothetical protein AB1813_28310, partial [Verrucomicrobiota bacterium]